MNKQDEIVTSDLAQFGARERKMLEDLMRAWREHGLPRDFNDDEVTAAMNRNSGYVFLTNSDYQIAMEEDGKLESFYNCPECGAEGLFAEIENLDDHQSGNAGECRRWIKDVRAGRNG